MDTKPDREPADAVAGTPERSRAHPLATAVYDALRDRSREDKVLVLQALERRATPYTMPEKQERAYHALAEFVEEQGRFPAANEWEMWRREALAAGTRGDLPSGTFIRNAFGSWLLARAAFEGAESPVPDVLARRLTALGPSLDDASLLEVVRVWARMQAGPLVRADFKAWLAHPRATAAAGLARAPSSYHPFERFGGWTELLVKAGFDPLPRGTLPRTRQAPPTDRDLLCALGIWAGDREGALLRGDFKAWWNTESVPGRPDLDAVSRGWRHIREAFGSWPAFLAAAGLSERGPGSANGRGAAIQSNNKARGHDGSR